MKLDPDALIARLGKSSDFMLGFSMSAEIKNFSPQWQDAFYAAQVNIADAVTVLANLPPQSPAAPGEPLTKEQLGELLATPAPDFDAWSKRMPDNYWARYDLSACKLGWMAALAPTPRGSQ